MRGAWFEMRDEASLLPFASVCHPVSRSPVLCENADTQGASGPHRQTNMHSAATVRFVLQRCWLTEPSLAGRAWQLQTFPQDFTATSYGSSVTSSGYSVRQSRFFTGFHSRAGRGGSYTSGIGSAGPARFARVWLGQHKMKVGPPARPTI